MPDPPSVGSGRIEDTRKVIFITPVQPAAVFAGAGQQSSKCAYGLGGLMIVVSFFSTLGAGFTMVVLVSVFFSPGGFTIVVLFSVFFSPGVTIVVSFPFAGSELSTFTSHEVRM